MSVSLWRPPRPSPRTESSFDSFMSRDVLSFLPVALVILRDSMSHRLNRKMLNNSHFNKNA